MIAAVFSDSRAPLAEEFFQLFKIPWERYQSDKKYDAIICFGVAPPCVTAAVTVVYSHHFLASDADTGHNPISTRSGMTVRTRFGETFLPGDVSIILGPGTELLHDKTTGSAIGRRIVADDRFLYRFGFDLLEQVRVWLTHGQAPEHATMPALDVQIALLRNLLIERQVPFAEILSRPADYAFIACLTHDVDFAGIRNHTLDRTLLGFLYRSTIGSVIAFVSRRLRAIDLLRNILAFLSLPLVFLRAMPDFMNCFERYRDIEGQDGSTFFIVPFANKPGDLSPQGQQSEHRAIKYEIDDIKSELCALAEAGAELSVHGLDAWHSIDAAIAELWRLREFGFCAENPGMRMHWLWHTADTPKILERAGYAYDSTVGYNDAVGFRSATVQAYRPLGCRKLMELPLTLQDTALFYPARMNLKHSDAETLTRILVDNVTDFGGVLVTNWHQRSLAPERLWGRFYRRLIKHLKTRNAWFATGARAAAWFEARRQMSFVSERMRQTDRIQIRGTWPSSLPLPKIEAYGNVDVTGADRAVGTQACAERGLYESNQ